MGNVILRWIVNVSLHWLQILTRPRRIQTVNVATVRPTKYSAAIESRMRVSEECIRYGTSCTYTAHSGPKTSRRPAEDAEQSAVFSRFHVDGLHHVML